MKSQEKRNAALLVCGSSSKTFPAYSCELAYNASITMWDLHQEDICPCRLIGY